MPVNTEITNKNTEELEEETKSLLSKSNFNLLIAHFHLDMNQAVTQVNSYHDAGDLRLDEKDITLRVRKKKGQYELTLKQDAGDAAKETTYKPLSDEEFNDLRDKGIIPKCNVKDTLREMNIAGTFPYQGDLTTDRIEINYKGCKLALDYNKYMGEIDYEIEMEKSDADADQKKILHELLVELNVPYTPAECKRRRFFKHKKAQFFKGEI